MTPLKGFKVGTWDLTQFSQSPPAVSLYFPESHRWSEISSLSKVILVFGKARSCRALNLGCRGAESPGWFDVSQENCTRCDAWVGRPHAEAAHHQLPIAAGFWIICTVFLEECSSLTQNLMQFHCSSHSVILNETATQSKYPLHGVYLPPRLVQWSGHCSHMHIPAPSPGLPGYMDVPQTILIILTVVGLFPDRPQYIYLCLCLYLS